MNTEDIWDQFSHDLVVVIRKKHKLAIHIAEQSWSRASSAGMFAV